jgi:hypothetical protein
MTRVVGPGAVAFLAFWVLLLVAGRSSFFRDPGTFWHTTTGEKILHEGFIRTDPYTFTFAGRWWVPYQWLGEVGMALAHRLGGFDTQLLGAATILAAVFAWLTVRLLRTGLNPAVVAGLVALALAAAGSHFHVRPHLVTLACLTVTMVWLVDVDAGRAKLSRLGWLVPLFVIWTNVHGGMLGGVASLGLVFAGWLLFWLAGRQSPLESWRDVRFLVLVGLGCGLAALGSPYGPDLVKTWHVILGEPALRQIIQEHRPLDLTRPYAWPVLGMAAVFLFVLLGVPRSEWRASWFLPLFWLVQSFGRCRHAPLFAVVALVAVTAMWPHTRWAAWAAKRRPDFYTPPRGDEPRSPWWANVWLPAVVVLASLALQVNRVAVPVVGSGWARHDPNHWPVELLDVLKAHEPKSAADPHRVFNEYIDGGFLIYHAPNYRVFVDDRCELFGGAWLLAFVEAYSTGTAEAVAKWEAEYGRFDFALTRTGSGYDEYFSARPEWRAVKKTPTAAFYTRIAH